MRAVKVDPLWYTSFPSKDEVLTTFPCTGLWVRELAAVDIKHPGYKVVSRLLAFTRDEDSPGRGKDGGSRAVVVMVVSLQRGVCGRETETETEIEKRQCRNSHEESCTARRCEEGTSCDAVKHANGRLQPGLVPAPKHESLSATVGDAEIAAHAVIACSRWERHVVRIIATDGQG